MTRQTLVIYLQTRKSSGKRTRKYLLLKIILIITELMSTVVLLRAHTKVLTSELLLVSPEEVRTVPHLELWASDHSSRTRKGSMASHGRRACQALGCDCKYLPVSYICTW